MVYSKRNKQSFYNRCLSVAREMSDSEIRDGAGGRTPLGILLERAGAPPEDAKGSGTLNLTRADIHEAGAKALRITRGKRWAAIVQTSQDMVQEYGQIGFAEQVATLAAGIHSAIAGDVWPHGGRLTCQICGYSRPFTVEEAARYLAQGWPKHCDVTMRSEAG